MHVTLPYVLVRRPEPVWVLHNNNRSAYIALYHFRIKALYNYYPGHWALTLLKTLSLPGESQARFISSRIQAPGSKHKELSLPSQVPIAAGWTEAMRIKYLAQGHNTLAWPGIEPSTSRTRAQRLNHSSTVLHNLALRITNNTWK